jgi:hypothetical protein
VQEEAVMVGATTVAKNRTIWSCCSLVRSIAMSLTLSAEYLGCSYCMAGQRGRERDWPRLPHDSASLSSVISLYCSKLDGCPACTVHCMPAQVTVLDPSLSLHSLPSLFVLLLFISLVTKHHTH